jgi:mRNA interferase RelE/StbE
MTRYRLYLTKSARKEFDSLSAKIKDRVTDALKLLEHNPFSELLQIKKLKGEERLYRARIGDYRIVYAVEKRQIQVIVIKIGHRKEVYRGF